MILVKITIPAICGVFNMRAGGLISILAKLCLVLRDNCKLKLVLQEIPGDLNKDSKHA